MKERLPFPKTREFAALFRGRDAPSMKYELDPDNVRFKKLKFSVGKSERFFIESQLKSIRALPLQYQKQHLNGSSTEHYKKVSFGYGNRGDNSLEKKERASPSPARYNPHLISGIGYQSPYKSKNKLPSQHSFGVKYDRWDKVIYHGQEKHLHGREGKGPGAYNVDLGTIA